MFMNVFTFLILFIDNKIYFKLRKNNNDNNNTTGILLLLLHK
uniref:Uncharacterized protein n=1 Tax=viral metagenome TaxID=1070528 RepID=A0A6C0B6D2_9ZZZZ